MNFKIFLSCTLIAICLISFSSKVEPALLGIDLGTEWFKVVLMETKSFDIVLNDQSGRKTRSLVGFTKEDERFFGAPAAALSARYPDRVYGSTHQLLGKNFSNPIINSLSDHFNYPLVETTQGGYGIKKDDQILTSEEVVGMLLAHAQSLATKVSKTGAIKDCVIVVPPFLTQHERQSLINAASIGGLNVLSLVNEGLGAAINYALTRNLGDNVDQYVLFYDMGAGTTTATLVNYKTTDDSKTNSTYLNIQPVGVAWDQGLGGREFDLCLANHFLSNAEKKYKTTLKSNPRVFARMMKEVQKSKEILSANQDAQLYIESLTNEIDLRETISRADFESMCGSLFERAIKPIALAIEQSGISIDQLSAIELLGGGTRIPKVQDQIGSVYGAQLVGRHLNGDEAEVNGASFFGATLSSSFRVKNQIKFADITPFQYSVVFHGVKGVNEEEEGEEDSEDTRTVIFRFGKRFGSKRTLSLRQADSFSFDIMYDSTDLLPAGTDPLIARYLVTGIPTNSSSLQSVGTPKVQLLFKLSNSGTVEVTKAQAEVTTITYKEVKKVKEQKIEDVKVEINSENNAENVENVENNEQNADNNNNNNNEKEGEEKVAEKVENNEENGEKEEDEYEIVPEKKVVLFELTLTPLITGIDTTAQSISKSRELLKGYDLADKERREKEEAKNALESFLYGTREKMYEDSFIAASTEAERESLSEKLSEFGDWLYDEGENAATKEYKSRLNQLETLHDKIIRRINESENRPVYVPLFRDILANYSTEIHNLAKEREITEEEVNQFLEQVSLSLQWINDKEAEQASKALSEDPAFTIEDITSRGTAISGEYKKLSRKTRRKPIKPKEAKEKEEELKEETKEEVKEEKKEETKENIIFEFGDNLTEEEKAKLFEEIGAADHVV